MNEVNARRARLLLGWVTVFDVKFHKNPLFRLRDAQFFQTAVTNLSYRYNLLLADAGIPSRYVTSQLGQLSLASFRGRLIEYQRRLG